MCLNRPSEILALPEKTGFASGPAILALNAALPRLRRLRKNP
jgi:hypothetical protein